MKYYHNPRCRKSREGLTILEDKGISPEIILYLKDPISKDDLVSILSKLNIPAKDLIRKSEAIYKQQYKNQTLSEDEFIAIMVENPILIERPIFTNENKGVVGRPPEKVLEII